MPVQTRNLRFLILLLFTSPALSQEAAEPSSVPFHRLFYDFDSHLLGSFTHNYGLNHLLGGTLTYGIIHGGIDWGIYTTARDNKAIAYAGFPSVIVGGLTSLVVPTWLYLRGKSRDDYELQVTGMALGQAALLSFLVSSTYKTFTGRRPPEVFDDRPNEPDFSNDFRFGLMNRGIFDGWPSGHTMAAFAMATTLIELYPENGTVRTYALLYATAIGLGVSLNIHWFSDAVAGALIGSSIGKSVGGGFRRLLGKPQEEEAIEFRFTPSGITVVVIF